MTLELLKYDTCPYCRRVMDYIASVGRTDVSFQDIHKNPAVAERLLSCGGKIQVPCLFIDGRPLYESLDIIDWLKEHPENTQA